MRSYGPGESAATYDRLAPWYDLLTLPEHALRQHAMRLLAPAAGERVLVVGSGTGQELVALARAGAQAVGVDLSLAMCRRAQARLGRARLCGRAVVLCGDALRLPLADRACHAAAVVFTLELLETEHVPTALAEIGRALRPGGRLVVACLSQRQPTPMVRLYQWARARWPRYLDCRPILVAPLLQAVGWRVVRLEQTSVAGLPVDLALALRREETPA